MTKFWRSIGGRKFFGFMVATGLLIARFITQEIWVAAFLIYVSANAYQKYLEIKK